jgi:tyrosine aminotransferase
LFRLTTVILGANTLIQAALPEIFKNTPQDFFDRINKQLSEHAALTVARIEKAPGLTVRSPKGAMYCMVGIDVKRFSESTNGAIHDDITFAQALLREESVVVLPGQCFRSPNYFRIVFCPSIDKLEDAYKRIAEFCTRKLGL